MADARDRSQDYLLEDGDVISVLSTQGDYLGPRPADRMAFPLTDADR